MAEHAPFDIRHDDRPLHSGFSGGVHHCLGHFVYGNTGPLRLPLRFTPEP